MSMRPLQIGMLGTARIARQFDLGVAPSALAEAVAIASRDAAKASAFASDLGITQSLVSYDEMLASPDVDASVLSPMS